MFIEAFRVAFPSLTAANREPSRHTSARTTPGSTTPGPGVPPLPPVTEMTEYPPYPFPTGRLPDASSRDYYGDIKKGYKENNDLVEQTQYRIGKSRDNNVWIQFQQTGEIIFKCSNVGIAPRNLLLELHSCHYKIPEWRMKRDQGEFDNFSYESSTSPATKCVALREPH